MLRASDIIIKQSESMDYLNIKDLTDEPQMENMTHKMSGVKVHVVPAGLFTVCPNEHLTYLFMIG